MVYPILIPSKNRPNSKLFNSLKTDNLLFNIIVEPQDYETYQDAGYKDNLIILPENNRGLAYSRNFILNLARNSKYSWFWMLDDDITNFYETIDNKTKITNPTNALSIAEDVLTKQKGIGQLGLEYQQFAWSQKKDFAVNSYCDVCVCINVQATKKINYREEVLLKEDRDFTLQILSKGYQTLRVSKSAFSCPKNGSNKGGLFDIYQSDREKLSVLKMCELWGSSICTPQTKADGRFDVKINWKYFKN